MIEAMEVRLYEHENFVWLDHSAVSEVLDNRKPASSDPMVIYNNLLRWSLYQLDRNACVEIDDKTGNDIPLQERLNWIRRYKTDNKYVIVVKTFLIFICIFQVH